ncbi:MAG: hypothetical protein K5Q00_03550 [Gammaproteobacteria bacterium]|nr:hypothetical protein [Gammaproteobacteria bacterium]
MMTLNFLLSSKNFSLMRPRTNLRVVINHKQFLIAYSSTMLTYLQDTETGISTNVAMTNAALAFSVSSNSLWAVQGWHSSEKKIKLKKYISGRFRLYNFRDIKPIEYEIRVPADLSIISSNITSLSFNYYQPNQCAILYHNQTLLITLDEKNASCNNMLIIKNLDLPTLQNRAAFFNAGYLFLLYTSHKDGDNVNNLTLVEHHPQTGEKIAQLNLSFASPLELTSHGQLDVVLVNSDTSTYLLINTKNGLAVADLKINVLIDMPASPASVSVDFRLIPLGAYTPQCLGFTQTSEGGDRRILIACSDKPNEFSIKHVARDELIRWYTTHH